MPKLKPRLGAHCSYCTRPESECGSLSYRSICKECAREAQVANAVQLNAKRGPYAKHHLEGCLRSAEKGLEKLSRTA